MSTALDRLPPYARGLLTDALRGADNPNNTTRAAVVDTLPDKVDVLQRFSIEPRVDGWDVRVMPVLDRSWVVRWDHLTLYVPSFGDFALARSAVTQRQIAAKRLRVDVVKVVDAFGIRDRRRFLKPAPLAATRAALTTVAEEERDRRRAEYWQ